MPARIEVKLVEGSVYEKPLLYCAVLFGSCTAASQRLRASYSQSARTKLSYFVSLKLYWTPSAVVNGELTPGAYLIAACPEIASPLLARQGAAVADCWQPLGSVLV